MFTTKVAMHDFKKRFLGNRETTTISVLSQSKIHEK